MSPAYDCNTALGPEGISNGLRYQYLTRLDAALEFRWAAYISGGSVRFWAHVVEGSNPINARVGIRTTGLKSGGSCCRRSRAGSDDGTFA